MAPDVGRQRDRAQFVYAAFRQVDDQGKTLGYVSSFSL
jgi:hypothetical protein